MNVEQKAKALLDRLGTVDSDCFNLRFDRQVALKLAIFDELKVVLLDNRDAIARALEQPEGRAGGEVEPDCECVESDGCPTEGAVLKRFWRSHQTDPKLCEFYGVKTMAELLSAQEEHILKLQDAARRNVKPWEDTFPPTLLPKYLRESGLAAAEPAARTVVIHTTPPAKVPDGYVLVPAEPTPEMVMALAEKIVRGFGGREAYTAMLAAAQQQEKK